MTVTFDPEVTADEFRGRRVTIIGLGKGRTTAGLARFLVGKGANVTIADPKPREELVDGGLPLAIALTARVLDFMAGTAAADILRAEGLAERAFRRHRVKMLQLAALDHPAHDAR